MSSSSRVLRSASASSSCAASKIAKELLCRKLLFTPVPAPTTIETTTALHGRPNVSAVVALRRAARAASTASTAPTSRVLRTDSSTVVWFNNKNTGVQTLLELRRGALTWPSFPASEPQRTWATEAEWRAATGAKPIVSTLTLNVYQVQQGNHTWYFDSSEEAEEFMATHTF